MIRDADFDDPGTSVAVAAVVALVAVVEARMHHTRLGAAGMAPSCQEALLAAAAVAAKAGSYVGCRLDFRIRPSPALVDSQN